MRLLGYLERLAQRIVLQKDYNALFWVKPEERVDRCQHKFAIVSQACVICGVTKEEVFFERHISY